jgi:hypothetical protein
MARELSGLTIDVELKDLTPEIINTWEKVNGRPFPKNFSDYAENYLVTDMMAYINEIKRHVQDLERKLTEHYQYAENVRYIEMGRDFEKILDSIHKNPNVKKEWDKFCMYWRLNEPGASENEGSA